MKELKFRQFVNGRWHYWGNLGDVTSFVGPVTPKVESFMSTGLYDKNNKEIYEGEILLIADTRGQEITKDKRVIRTILEPFNSLAPVVFEEGGFGVNILRKGLEWGIGFASFGLLDYHNYFTGHNFVEIRGNIIENPELLKGNELK